MSSMNPGAATGPIGGQEPVAFRVLTIVARPLDEHELPDIADSWALSSGLCQVEAPVQIRFLEPPTVESFRSALQDQWDVIHFDGHGLATDEGGLLAFENEDGTHGPLLAVDFVEMLKLLGRVPPLLILSACESASGPDDGLAGRLVQAGLPAVIGTRESVTVDWTMKLMRPLYSALGRGRSIQSAFDYARPALRPLANPISETPSFDLPVLLGTGINECLCNGKLRGHPTIEQPLLVNWTERSQSKFQSDFIDEDGQGHRLDPPQGRKGLIVQATRALLRDEKLISLTGPGGIGKTAMATVIARRMAWRYSGGVFWVDGRDYMTGEIPLDTVLDSFADVFGPSRSDFLKSGPAQKRNSVRAYMDKLDSPCLLVIDNADVIGREAMRFVTELPGRCATLLTTREAPEKGGVVVGLKVMSPKESLSLLLAEIGRRKNSPGWHLRFNQAGHAEIGLSHTDQAALLEIARLLDGHPLALLQAAALVATDGLTRTLKLVQAHPAQGKEIRERFDFSYLPLKDSQKSLLHRLSAFAADFAETALSAICTDKEFTPIDEQLPHWESDLRALRDKSLVEQMDQSSTERRFRLHPVMRDYIREKVAERRQDDRDKPQTEPGQELLRREDLRVASYFLSLAKGLAGQLGNTEIAFTAIKVAEQERLNLLQGQVVFRLSGMLEKAVSFINYLNSLFQPTRHTDDRGLTIEAVLAEAKAVNSMPENAAIAHNLGVLAQNTGEIDEARRLYEESLLINRELGNKAGEAKSLHQLGMLAQDTGEIDEARRLYEESLRINRELGNKAGEAKSLHQLGILAQDTGEIDEARRLYEESLRINRELDNKSGEAKSLHQLGILAQDTGELDEGLRLYQESLRIKREQGNKAGVASSLHQLGIVAQDTGEIDQARRLYEESLRINRELGNKAGVASSLHRLGMLVQDTGELDEAQRLYEESLRIECELGNKAGVASSLHQLGILAQDTGEIDQARRLYEESLRIKRELGNKAGVAKSLHQLGTLAQDRGEIVQARRLYEESLRIERELGNKAGVASSLHELGRLAQAAGELDEARQLYEESLRINRELGDKNGQAISTAQLALLEEAAGDDTKALELIRLAEQMFIELGSPMREQAKQVRERLEGKVSS